MSDILDQMILTGVTDFTLGQQGLTARDCDRLLALLSEHEREAISSAEEGLRMEYVMLRNTLDSLQQGRMSPKQFAQLIAAGLGESQAAGVEQRINQANWQAEITACNTAFAAAIALAAVPYDQAHTEQWVGSEIPKVRAQNVFLTLTLLPAVDAFLEATARDHARLAGVECLTAVQRYTITHGSLPNDLEVAVREAGLKAVPTDPYSGQAMRYKAIDGKPVVYSVGSDRKDDGGVIDWNDGKQPGDFIFRVRE